MGENLRLSEKNTLEEDAVWGADFRSGPGTNRCPLPLIQSVCRLIFILSQVSMSFFADRCTSLALITLALAVALGCHSADVHRSLARQLHPIEGSPVVLAAYQPWFGHPDHMDIGYSSQDRVVLAKQIEQAQGMGISAFVVDWYDKRQPFLDNAFSLLQETAAQKNFRVALMYDEPADSSDATASAISAFDYAYSRYIGPEAPNRTAYLTYDGRPVIFIWPRNKQTDWHAVRQHVSAWDSNPVLLMEDGGMRDADVLDGYYAWVKPGEAGWSPNGSNWGRDYLEGFYRKMKTKYPDKIAVGAAWPGFDDRKASWSLNRYMDRRCGKTFEDSLKLFRRYYTNADPLPFLMVVTWNDYEEGTAIERGIEDCSRHTASQSADGKGGN